ncbi:MAG: lipopolysaccharide biosynthesis protein [Prolixibacteraceae bacterium]|nr:lipopolysaccharide biosynthesis protein [Prolixibacteraceae bacterium]
MSVFDKINSLRLKPEGLFLSESISKDLSGKSVRGGIITLGSTAFLFVTNIGRTVVLARLLTPEDFGIIGMVAVFINFISIFKDAGLSMATVQKDNISNEQISKLAWLNLLITVSLGLVIILASPLVAMFYNKQELTFVTIALSFSFIIEGFTIQHRALLQRHMRFDSLNIVTITSSLAGIFASIFLSIMGWRYWALVSGTIFTSVCAVFLTYYFCPWIPKRNSNEANVKSMFNFGLNLTTSSVVNFFARQADKIIIGKIVGAVQLGLYDKAYQLFRMPTANILSPIRNVAMPALSSIQKEKEQYLKYYKSIILLTATFVFPLSVYFYIEADFIINLILGNQWLGAIPIFKLLAIGGLIQPITGQSGIVMLSTGNTKRYLHWQIFYSTCLVISFIIGIRFGVTGLATAYAIAEFILFLPGLLHNYKNTPVKPLIVLNELIIPILVSLFAAFTLLAARSIFKTEDIIIHISYAILFFSLYSVITWQRKDFRHTIQLMVSKISSD